MRPLRSVRAKVMASPRPRKASSILRSGCLSSLSPPECTRIGGPTEFFPQVDVDAVVARMMGGLHETVWAGGDDLSAQVLHLGFDAVDLGLLELHVGRQQDLTTFRPERDDDALAVESRALSLLVAQDVETPVRIDNGAIESRCSEISVGTAGAHIRDDVHERIPSVTSIGDESDRGRFPNGGSEGPMMSKPVPDNA